MGVRSNFLSLVQIQLARNQLAAKYFVKRPVFITLYSLTIGTAKSQSSMGVDGVEYVCAGWVIARCLFMATVFDPIACYPSGNYLARKVACLNATHTRPMLVV